MTKKLPTKCPYCGCTEAYTKERPVDPVHVVYNLKERVVDYSAMWDSLSTIGGDILWCNDCGRKVGRVDDATDFRNSSELDRW